MHGNCGAVEPRLSLQAPILDKAMTDCKAWGYNAGGLLRGSGDSNDSNIAPALGTGRV